MNLNKNLCEKLYFEVKTKLQEAFIQRGMTFKGSETSIWKLNDGFGGKTFFQKIIEESTGISFSTTFNSMYLWRKWNEAKSVEVVNFQEDYLQIFIKFIGYANPQDYISAFSLTLHTFFGIKKEGKILVIQPIFDSNLAFSNSVVKGKFPLINEQTVDSRDTECLLELIHLFHNYNQTLPKRIYDQEIIQLEDGILSINETVLNQNKPSCIFSIGFYSNYFFRWVLENHAHHYIEYTDDPMRFRVRYFNEHLKQPVWTDYYDSNSNFDTGFLLKLAIKLGAETINCYFLCGMENKGTWAITNFLCQNWTSLQQKCDFDRDIPLLDAPFMMVLKVNKNNIAESYLEKIIKIDF
ncbi:hypothetical protein [Flavobacterium branchiophilum]|nr:hypothetical protein [Flavobacterium branchiophilum]PDS25804.1 hypothetical protein B0A77_04005 [Flavobacterium branchiophilum]